MTYWIKSDGIIDLFYRVIKKQGKFLCTKMEQLQEIPSETKKQDTLVYS